MRCWRGGLDLVIDECDSLDIKVLLRLEARRHRIPVIMDTSDRGMMDIERFDLEPERSIFHGLIEDMPLDALRGLSTEDKIPYVLNIVGRDTMSPRLRASMLEIGQSISTWPQLGADVTCGGAIAAEVARRIALDQPVPSGRYFVEFDGLSRGSQSFPEWLSTLGADCAAAGWRTPEALCLDSERLARLLTAAVAAPSGGNMQPWLWVSHGPILVLVLDRRRCGSGLDFEGRGGLVALGAATENLVLAAHGQGLEVRLHALPLPHMRDVVAAFEFVGVADGRTEPHSWDRLRAVTSVRHTNRRVAVRQPLSPVAQAAIVQAARSIPGAAVQLHTAPEVLHEVGQILGAGDRLRLLNRALHAELVSEICWSLDEAEERRDGIAIEEMALRPLDRAGLEMCRHWAPLEWLGQWGQGHGFERMAQKAIEAASAVMLVTMPQTRPIDYFNGGGRCSAPG